MMESLSAHDVKVEPVSAARLSMETLQNELEILKANVQKRKREINMLRSMIYVGVLLVAAGFFISNNSFQEPQLDNIDGRIQRLETNQRVNMTAIQDNMHRQIQEIQMGLVSLEEKTLGTEERPLTQILDDLNQSLSQLDAPSPVVQKRIQQVKDSTRQFLEAYRKAKPTARKSTRL